MLLAMREHGATAEHSVFWIIKRRAFNGCKGLRTVRMLDVWRPPLYDWGRATVPFLAFWAQHPCPATKNLFLKLASQNFTRAVVVYVLGQLWQFYR